MFSIQVDLDSLSRIRPNVVQHYMGPAGGGFIHCGDKKSVHHLKEEKRPEEKRFACVFVLVCTVL